MTKVRLLRQSALDTLRQSIGQNLAAYRNGDFDHLSIDQSLYFSGATEVDYDALTGLLNPDGAELFEVENCQKCYSALAALTPYEARDERLWVYLTHTTLLEYGRKRWPIPDDNAEAIKHIHQHFFAKGKREVERDNAASRLWWMAHLCGRVKGLDLASSLKVFLYRSDVRAGIVERPTVSQNLALFSSMIRSLYDSYLGKKELFERQTFRRLMREINSIGGVLLLDGMNEEQIGQIIKGVLQGLPA